MVPSQQHPVEGKPQPLYTLSVCISHLCVGSLDLFGLQTRDHSRTQSQHSCPPRTFVQGQGGVKGRCGDLNPGCLSEPWG